MTDKISVDRDYYNVQDSPTRWDEPDSYQIDSPKDSKAKMDHYRVMESTVDAGSHENDYKIHLRSSTIPSRMDHNWSDIRSCRVFDRHNEVMIWRPNASTPNLRQVM